MKYLHSIPDHMMYLGMVCVRLRLMSHPDVYDRILSFRELPSTRGIRTSRFGSTEHGSTLFGKIPLETSSHSMIMEGQDFQITSL